MLGVENGKSWDEIMGLVQLIAILVLTGLIVWVVITWESVIRKHGREVITMPVGKPGKPSIAYDPSKHGEKFRDPAMDDIARWMNEDDSFFVPGVHAKSL